MEGGYPISSIDTVGCGVLDNVSATVIQVEGEGSNKGVKEAQHDNEDPESDWRGSLISVGDGGVFNGVGNCECVR